MHWFLHAGLRVHDRYIHLPGSLDVATRIEAKRKEVDAARKLHELQQGPPGARGKGEAFAGAGAAWEQDWDGEAEEDGAEEEA